MWAPTLVGIGWATVFIVFLGARYGWKELRDPETWIIAVLVGIGGFLVAILHPSWMPRGAASPGR